MANQTRDPSDDSAPDADAAPGGPASSRGFGRWLFGFFGRRNADATLRQSLEEVIEEHQERSTSITEQEQLMLLNILHFGEARVEDVMVPRADIVSVEQDEPLEELIKVFCDAGHSRLPVYRETLDDPLGMYHIKDLLPLILDEMADKKAQANALAKRRRPVLFVPPSMPALDLFLKMQTTRTHMALVIDEYGGTDGLVTIEDLVEEIVGEIEDEHDSEEGPLIEKLGEGSYLVDARAPIEDLERLVGIKLILDQEDEDLETVGGLIVTTIDRVPERGELITHPAGLEFEVLDADPRKVKKLRVQIKPSLAEVHNSSKDRADHTKTFPKT